MSGTKWIVIDDQDEVRERFNTEAEAKEAAEKLALEEGAAVAVGTLTGICTVETKWQEVT